MAALVGALLAGCGGNDAPEAVVLAPGIAAVDLAVTPEHTLVGVREDGTGFTLDGGGAVTALVPPPQLRCDGRGAGCEAEALPPIPAVEPPVVDAATRGDDLFVLHGLPERLSRCRAGACEAVPGGDLPGARAIVFGNGGGLDPAHLYVAEPDAITILRPPP